MRPTEVLCEVRKLYKKGSVAARTLAVLNPLPKYFKHRRGGRVPQRSLSGVYHGAVISTGASLSLLPGWFGAGSGKRSIELGVAGRAVNQRVGWVSSALLPPSGR
jgi:hypothetical protein